jgi:hypothetical protein
MPKLIKNGEVTENPWVTLTSEEVVGANLASGQWLIPLSDYLTFVERKVPSLQTAHRGSVPILTSQAHT